MFATAAAIFSILLIITGVAKVARPHDVTKALVDLGLPRLPGAGLIIGLVEVAVGVAAVLNPGALVAQGALYSVFALWVFIALRSDAPIASCGCMGRDDTPPTVAHVALSGLAALLSFGAANEDGHAVDSMLHGIAQLAIVAVGAFLAYIVLNQAAQLAGARRS